MDNDRNDIDAKPESPAPRDQMLLMLRTLLADRFQLTFHRETKSLPMNTLVVAKGGPKFGPQFHAVKEGDPAPDNRVNGEFPCPRCPMDVFAGLVYRNMQMFDPSTGPVPPGTDVVSVLDKTGLTGDYDIILKIDTHEDWPGMLERQLGLKLELRKVPIEVTIVDQAVKPAAN